MTKAQEFSDRLRNYRELPADLISLIERLADLPTDTALLTSVASLSGRPEEDQLEDWCLLALMPAIVIAHSALRDGVDIPKPIADLGLPADFLQRILRRPLSKLEQEVINLDFVLHADHGANASAFAARVAKSTLSDTYQCVTAAIATFAGARHGGAVLGVIKMLDEFGDRPEDCQQYIRECTKAGRPIMGFGHRVYKVEDPRAKLFHKAAEALADEKGDWVVLNKLSALVEAMKPYERSGIGPNVDLYAAAVYLLLGIRAEQATAFFAVARTAGWIAQIREQAAGSNLLIRPRLEYKGHTYRQLP